MAALVVGAATAASSGPALAVSSGHGRPATVAPSSVNTAPEDCVVPDLRGRTIPQIDYSKILAGLVASGNPTHFCSAGAVTMRHPVRPSHGQPEVVVSQSPRPGVRVPPYSPVSLVLAPARPPTNPGACHLFAGTDAVARSAGVVVYRTYQEIDIGGDPALPVLNVRWRACARPGGRRQTIFTAQRTDEGYVDAGQFVVSGRYVAHTTDTVETKYSGGFDSRAIDVFDLATGRQTADLAVGHTYGPGNDPPGTPPVPAVASLAVSTRGFVAWIDAYPIGAILYVSDSHGTRAVATGSPGAIAAVSLQGNALSWDVGGARQTAELG